MITRGGTLMITWGKYSDDYESEGTLMITSHYRVMGFGYPLRNQQFDFSITKKSKLIRLNFLNLVHFQHKFFILF